MEWNLSNWTELLNTVVVPFALRIVAGLVILVVGWVAAVWISGAVRRRMERSSRLDPTLAKFVAGVIKVGILAFAIVAMLSKVGVQTASVIAVLGAAGLAVGLALQGTLSHLAAGVMLLIFRPFKVGDAVAVAGKAGMVEEIGLFAVQLRSFDGVYQLIPNGGIWGDQVVNYSRSATRRADMIFGISYGDDIGAALDIVREELEGDERVLDDPAPVLEVDSLGDSSVNLLVRFWVEAGDLFAIRWHFNRRIKERFDAAGITIPFPQQDVHLFRAEE